MLKQTIGRIKTASKTVVRANLDGLDLLRSDHMKVEAMLLQLRLLRDADRRSRILKQIKNELDLHMKLEEQIFYPACERNERLCDLVEHSYDEHAQVKKMLRELTTMDKSSARFPRLVAEVIEAIEHHVHDEEDELFPKVRSWMSETDFKRLSKQMLDFHSGKKVEPIRKTTRKAA